MSNFKVTLPEPDSDLANAYFKSHYNFEFLKLSEKVKDIIVVNWQKFVCKKYNTRKKANNFYSLSPNDVVKNWLKCKATIAFLSLWAMLNNPDFNGVEFDSFKNDFIGAKQALVT